MAKNKRYIVTAVATLIIAVSAWVLHPRLIRPTGETVEIRLARAAKGKIPQSEHPEGISELAPTKPDKRRFTEEEMIAFKAFVPPIWDDSTLVDCGFDDPQKDALDAHIEDTYFLMMELIATHGEVVTRTSHRTMMRVALPEQTADQIRAFFYKGLEGIVGQQGMRTFNDSGSVDYIETELLGFGEMPMLVAVDSSSDGSPTRLTISTMHIQKGAMVTDSRAITYQFPHQTIHSILPNLSKRLLENEPIR